MGDHDTNPRAVIGGNNPPEPTPFEKAESEINSLFDEAKLWLDGAKVDSQELADGIANLLNMIRDAEKRADEARSAEKKPFDDAGAEVQARYAPLIGNTKTIKGKTVLAAEACKKALREWLEKKDREQREAAEKARREADDKLKAAQEAFRTTDATNLEQREATEALAKQAIIADRVASKTERATAKAGHSSVGRSASLRTVYTPKLTDLWEAVGHYMAVAPNELGAFLQTLAERDVRAGRRDIPGFTITEEKKVA